MGPELIDWLILAANPLQVPQEIDSLRSIIIDYESFQGYITAEKVLWYLLGWATGHVVKKAWVAYRLWKHGDKRKVGLESQVHHIRKKIDELHKELIKPT